MVLKRSHLLSFGLLSIFTALVTACASSSQVTNETQLGNPALTIYWNQGFYPEEDEALQEIIAAWEKETNIPVNLSLFSSDDILNRTNVALENGSPPDIVFAHRADYTLGPIWAWNGELVDVSDVIEPYEDRYSSAALESAFLYNQADGTRSYYGVPIEQQTIHIHYWRDLLTEAGYDPAQIPDDWDAFWEFWKQAQSGVQTKGHVNTYGLGLTLSIQGSDTYYLFEQVLDAYDVELFDADGELQLNESSVRDGLIQVLDWTVQFYKGGYVPDDAINWLDSDNNLRFLNKNTLMTPNPSLSIPASQRDDADLYTEKIATQPFPNEPDGEPMSYLVSVKQALIFEKAQHPEVAKEFLAFLLQPEQLDTYVKGSLGRWFPVMEESLTDPFWTDSTDPHISVAVQQFTQGSTRPFYHVVNPAYAEVQAENVWGRAIGRVIVDNWTTEASVDEAIATIERIFAEWESADSQ